MAPPSLRLLVVAATLLAPALAQAYSTKLDFPSCVDDCVQDNGCRNNGARCICSMARMGYLVPVASCVARHCKSRSVSVNSGFLDPLMSGCSSMGMPIPKDKIDAAEKAASSQVDLLPPITQTRPLPTMTTIRPSSTASSRATGRNPSSTTRTTRPSSSSPDGSTTSSTAPPQSTAIAPSSSGSTSGSSSSASAPPPSEPTDSSPFAAPNSAAKSPVSWLWAVASLIAAVGLA